MLLNMQDVLDTDSILTLSIIAGLIRDDHASLEGSLVWCRPREGVVRVLMYWAAVAHTMTDSMREVAPNLPQMLACKVFQSHALGFICWETRQL